MQLRGMLQILPHIPLPVSRSRKAAQPIAMPSRFECQQRPCFTDALVILDIASLHSRQRAGTHAGRECGNERNHAVMLQSIRKGARSWLGIVLAMILIPPFAIVGVEYIFRDGFSRAEAVITVGEQKILGRDYERVFRHAMDSLRQNTGRVVDYRVAKSYGLVGSVANSLVTQALYQQATRDEGILIGDAVVREAVRNLDSFKGIDGRFDATIYENYLQNAQMTEQEFLDLQRSTIATQYLIQSVTGVEAASLSMVDAANRYRNEKRQAVFFTIRADSVKDLQKPSKKQLAAFHDKNNAKYTRPANRTVTFLHVKPEDVFDRITVKESEIQAVYQRDIARYTTPEKRTLRQLLFAKEEDAKKAYAAMIGGKTFDTVATDVVKRKPLNLGAVSAAELPLEELATAAFAVGQGEVTKPIKTVLGWHIVVVDKIEPGSVTPLLSVKKTIERTIKRKRSGKILDQLREDADDGLGADLTMARIAEQLKQRARTIPAIDARGRDAANKTVDGIPADGSFLRQVFSQETGREDREVIELKEGAFFIVEVKKMTPSRVMPLEDIKNEVMADWERDARIKALKVKADALVKRIRSGATIKEVARESEAGLMTSSPLTRYGATGDSKVSGALRDALFKAAKTGSVVAETGVDGYSIAVLTGIRIGGDAKAQRQAVSASLRQSLGQELLSQYQAMLRKRYPVKIERTEIDRLFSREGQGQQGM